MNAMFTYLSFINIYLHICKSVVNLLISLFYSIVCMSKLNTILGKLLKTKYLKYLYGVK